MRDHTGRTRGAGVKIEPDAFYPEQFVRELFGYTTETLRSYRQRRIHFPCCQVGKRYLYPGSGLLAALKRGAREVKQTPTER